MKLADTRAAYEALSGKASDIVRQLGLAAVGLIWIFKSGSATQPILEAPLLRAALFVFIALILDFFQYLLGTSIWFVYFRYKERNGTREHDEFLAPEQLNWPTWVVFYVKSAALVVAYSWYIVPF